MRASHPVIFHCTVPSFATTNTGDFAVSKKNKKNKTWGMLELQPHRAPPMTRILQPEYIQLVITPPSSWSQEKQRLFGMIEKSLLTMKEFSKLTVLPPGCLQVMAGVRHNIQGPRAA